MAVQIPNPGTGNGQTGDNEYVFRKKVRDNFSDQSNAASRILDPRAPEQMSSNKNIATALYSSNIVAVVKKANEFTPESMLGGDVAIVSPTMNVGPTGKPTNWGTLVCRQWGANAGAPRVQTFESTVDSHPRYMMRWEIGPGTNTYGEWADFYHTRNTTMEAGTNYLKVASPILRLQHNSFEKEHEAENMDIAVENPSVGVYKITGTTGLRDDGTWYFSPPKDEHNNVLCMVEVSEQDGVITVNTYKKKFDFETVSIVPDYEQPTDIPEGAIVMLRFNDLPQDEV